MDAERVLLQRFVPPAVSRVDARIVTTLRRVSVHLLRAALALVFVWFGALKLAGATPVADLVAQTLSPLPAAWSVPALGAIEVALGVGLLTMWLPRVTTAFFVMQMLGTFSVLALHPALAFENGSPLHLTILGEFVVKNLVLLTAGLVVASQVEPARISETS